ncbi:KAP family P-loop NTPase fold protein [Phaeobacter gallaeciensis]|uniref:KAP family P-loop domain protein n=1 Tax=Phaeobacter gallaeciensis TaxID=60890 RepID=A0AAC9Z700_9RHOB|nr:P-loop NTPase fold protein [Phaeobacter gallaeciensis]AHD08583.1 KAP family P-loop domain protein [Phaeobacter gallaeciensis DSM 26640]ATE91849.1 KAP family P-loop domain protein [Phaeobacter gallaeciensis]ATE98327.1 KAP family P-loop domain protein [Phaeobacter gallaeciensis]ATF00465.1 KAP family P-loop domain protein [Phaeobacter gallaeciensis]ATF04897.1 KAP family P-loop domain protein [Phaeobacter gallaeciensis]
MRLTVPNPKIKLYEDGFDGHDQLNRKATGNKLSDLVERIDDPLVIALDGAWGSGKSFFLKCWVGAHRKREGNTTETVYFDAFQHDFLDDPLIALTGAIAERFETSKAKETEHRGERSKKIKKAAWTVGKGALRIGASVATFGATEVLSEVGDVVAKAVGDEAKALLSSDSGDDEAEEFWSAHHARIAAMEAFRLALSELTEPDETEHPQRKLVIVIDELDRCRPDYALSLLEIIKHFFNVPGVHFVLGVNLKELQNSVRARYGSGVEAETYLQKFTTMQMTLNQFFEKHSSDLVWTKYFQKCAEQMEFPTEARALLKTTENILSRFKLSRDQSLRDAERVLTTLVAMPNLKTNFYLNTEVCIGTMAVLKVLAPSIYQTIRLSSGSAFIAGEHFETTTDEFDQHGELITLIWKALEDHNDLTTRELAELSNHCSSLRSENWQSQLGKVANKYLEVFDLSDF